MKGKQWLDTEYMTKRGLVSESACEVWFLTSVFSVRYGMLHVLRVLLFSDTYVWVKGKQGLGTEYTTKRGLVS